LQKLVLYICIVFLCAQCAQITPLTGGKRDNTPPKVISFRPENASLNFNSKMIEIQFDEYIILKDIANQFIITPQTKEIPDIQASGKKLLISFKEELLPNTTYKMAFGNAITDLNESNIIQNFEYIFSTGPNIDSLKIKGHILNMADKSPATQILVGLYDVASSDSVIYKDKPLYITKTDGSGNFSFNYLPDAKFKIVGIKDQNKNLMYDGSEEQIAFLKDPIAIKDTGNISLILFNEMPTKSFIKKTYTTEYGKAFIVYNKPQFDIINVNAKSSLINFKWNELRDTLSLFYNNKYDTLETYIQYSSKKTDTLLINILSEKGLKRNGAKINYTFKTNITSTLPFFALPNIELNFPINIKSINNSVINLIENMDNEAKPIPFTLLSDTGFINSFQVNALLKPETNYTLTIPKGAVSDNYSRTNDSTTFRFATTSSDDYAQLNLKLLFPKKENYIVMLFNEKDKLINKMIVEFSLASTSEKVMSYKNLLPGNYFIRIVEDINKNGAFDVGDYFLKKQPEVIFVNTTAIKLLAGWEIENEWIVK
jgi:hypothetical protein